MARLDLPAPAFVKETFYNELYDKLPSYLTQVRASYEEEHDLDVPLPTPNFRRTRPERFPAHEKTLIMFCESTEFDAPATAQRRGSAQDNYDPGYGVYASQIRVELLCRGGRLASASGLEDYEVLNIQCQNTIWAAYKAIVAIGQASPWTIEVHPMAFDNTRGQDWPLTEYGTFHFITYVG